MPSVALGNGVTLSYWEQGRRGGPTVTFLPGPTDSWRSYEPVLASLPGYIHAVAVSLRGHGDSSKPSSGYTVEDLAADVLPFLDALDISTTVLAGHSGSCLAARRLALEYPRRVTGLLLEASPTTLRGDPALREFVDTVLTALTDPIDREFARALIVDTSIGDLPPDLEAQLTDDVLKVPASAWKEMFASLLAYDDTAELSKTHAPALLVWGDADKIVPRLMQDQLLELLGRAELIIYPGAGHTPRWEHPARFAQDVTGFASRLLD